MHTILKLFFREGPFQNICYLIAARESGRLQQPTDRAHAEGGKVENIWLWYAGEIELHNDYTKVCFVIWWSSLRGIFD